MSIRDKCGGTKSTPPPALCQPTVVKVNYHHCEPVKAKKRRVPFMVNWCAQHAPYPPGSLVIHDCVYWYAEAEEYAPPGAANTWWKVWDLEAWLSSSSRLMTSEESFLSFPVYEDNSDVCGVPVKLNGQSVAPVERKIVKVFKQDSIVVAGGKLYYALHDNACTYPPSAQWGGGVSLNDLILQLLKQGG